MASYKFKTWTIIYGRPPQVRTTKVTYVSSVGRELSNETTLTALGPSEEVVYFVVELSFCEIWDWGEWLETSISHIYVRVCVCVWAEKESSYKSMHVMHVLCYSECRSRTESTLCSRTLTGLKGQRHTQYVTAVWWYGDRFRKPTFPDTTGNCCIARRVCIDTRRLSRNRETRLPTAYTVESLQPMCAAITRQEYVQMADSECASAHIRVMLSENQEAARAAHTDVAIGSSGCLDVR